MPSEDFNPDRLVTKPRTLGEVYKAESRRKLSVSAFGRGENGANAETCNSASANQRQSKSGDRAMKCVNCGQEIFRNSDISPWRHSPYGTEFCSTIRAEPAAPVSEPLRDNSEGWCRKCGGRNVTWFAPNSLWNRAVRQQLREQDIGSIICPICFVEMAELGGIRPPAWQVAPEGWSESDPRACKCHNGMPCDERCADNHHEGCTAAPLKTYEQGLREAVEIADYYPVEHRESRRHEGEIVPDGLATKAGIAAAIRARLTEAQK